MSQAPFSQVPRADHCPICGEVHAEIPESEACPTHGHRLYPVRRNPDSGIEVRWPDPAARWWLRCPTRNCTEGRWTE